MEQNKKESRKKLGLVALLLVALLAVGATAGTTLAKYITDGSVTSQTATVAKWGYTVSATNSMFGEKYKVGGEVSTADGDTIIVKKVTSDGNIVAPGTKGELSFTLNGANASEVDAQLVIDLSAWATTTFETVHLVGTYGETSSNVDYYPVVWTIGDTSFNKPTDSKSWQETFIAAFKTELAKAKYTPADGSAEVALGDLVSDAVSGKLTVNLPAGSKLASGGISLKVSWAWAFDNTTGTVAETNADAYDTLLGYLALGTGNYPTEYKNGGTTYTLANFATSSSVKITFPDITAQIVQLNTGITA